VLISRKLATTFASDGERALWLWPTVAMLRMMSHTAFDQKMLSLVEPLLFFAGMYVFDFVSGHFLPSPLEFVCSVLFVCLSVSSDY